MLDDDGSVLPRRPTEQSRLCAEYNEDLTRAWQGHVHCKPVHSLFVFGYLMGWWAGRPFLRGGGMLRWRTTRPGDCRHAISLPVKISIAEAGKYSSATQQRGSAMGFSPL